MGVERLIAPPLRRWASATELRTDQRKYPSLITRALELESRGGAAVMAGVLDAAEVLDHRTALSVIELGLDWPRGSVRIQALDLLAATDPDLARSRADVDPDAKVRAWTARRERRKAAAVRNGVGEGGSRRSQLGLFGDA